jgi:hypothetical protein
VAIGGIQRGNAFEVMSTGRPNALAVISAICVEKAGEWPAEMAAAYLIEQARRGGGQGAFRKIFPYYYYLQKYNIS